MGDLGWKYLTREDKESLLEGIREGKALHGPFHAEFYPADRCNIDCFFCSTAAIRGTDEIPLPRFAELLAELKTLGTRAIRLAGGGEPLFHRKIRDFLQAVKDVSLPIENITTNAVIMSGAVADLVAETTDQVTVSLNTADETTYAEMMRTPAKNFQRVVDNVKAMTARKGRRPEIQVQFLVWKGNWRTVPQMYQLARDLRADSIIFNGLSGLRKDQEMDAAETTAMLELYGDVIRRDEFRRVDVISSFEQDLQPAVAKLAESIAAERSQSFAAKLTRFLDTKEFSIADKLRHRKKLRERARVDPRLAEVADYCVIGWHSLVIRSSGEVAPCCILQGKTFGNVFTQSVKDVWFSPAYEEFRRELRRIMDEGDAWQPSQEEKTVDMLCAKRHACPMRNFYYQTDPGFVRDYHAVLTGAGARG